MQYEQVLLNWERCGPLAREQWSKLTEEDVASALTQDQLDAKIAEYYEITEQEAKHQTQEWSLKIEAQPDDVALPETGEREEPTTPGPKGRDQSPLGLNPAGSGRG
jgi:hypothetical protein